MLQQAAAATYAAATPEHGAPPSAAAAEAASLEASGLAEAVQAAVGAAMHAVKGEAAAELRQSLHAHLGA